MAMTGGWRAAVVVVVVVVVMAAIMGAIDMTAMIMVMPMAAMAVRMRVVMCVAGHYSTPSR